MKIVIPGGSGQLGRGLATAFATEGHDIVVLSRNADRTGPADVCVVDWHGRTVAGWAA